MKITVRELWGNITDSPEKLSYYDYAENKSGVFTNDDTREMYAFFKENADREIFSFVISLKTKEIHISIK